MLYVYVVAIQASETAITASPDSRSKQKVHMYSYIYIHSYMHTYIHTCRPFADCRIRATWTNSTAVRTLPEIAPTKQVDLTPHHTTPPIHYYYRVGWHYLEQYIYIYLPVDTNPHRAGDLTYVLPDGEDDDDDLGNIDKIESMHVFSTDQIDTNHHSSSISSSSSSTSSSINNATMTNDTNTNGSTESSDRKRETQEEIEPSKEIVCTYIHIYLTNTINALSYA